MSTHIFIVLKISWVLIFVVERSHGNLDTMKFYAYTVYHSPVFPIDYMLSNMATTDDPFDKYSQKNNYYTLVLSLIDNVLFIASINK